MPLVAFGFYDISNWLHHLSLLCCLQHISKQRVLGLSEDMMKKGKHFILIRNPLDILVSRLSDLWMRKSMRSFFYFWFIVSKSRGWCSVFFLLCSCSLFVYSSGHWLMILVLYVTPDCVSSSHPLTRLYLLLSLSWVWQS